MWSNTVNVTHCLLHAYDSTSCFCSERIVGHTVSDNIYSRFVFDGKVVFTEIKCSGYTKAKASGTGLINLTAAYPTKPQSQCLRSENLQFHKYLEF
jgi:hypothetical protein